MTTTSTLSPELLHAFEALPDPFLFLSPELTILAANQPYAAVTQKDLNTIKGRYMFEVFPDNPALTGSEATSALQASLNRVLEHKKPHTMPMHRYDIPHPEVPGVFMEKYWSIINSPVLDEKKEVAYIIHQVADVTSQVMLGQREKEEGQQTNAGKGNGKETDSLELENLNLQHLFMQAPAMICVLEGPEHKFKFVNKEYQQLAGNRPLLGKPISEAMPELESQPIALILDQVYTTGETIYAHEMKVQVDHYDTGVLGNNYYNFIYQATYNTDNEIDGVLLFAYEVTAQVVARQEVEKRELALQKLNQKLTEANSKEKAANEALSRMQMQLQKLNQELEQRVTDRTKELEQSKLEIERQRNFLHTIFMKAPTPFLMLSGKDMVFELVNPAFRQIFPGRDVVGKTLEEAFPELQNTPIPAILLDVYNTGEPFEGKEYHLMLSRSEGGPREDFYFTFTYQARHDEEGRINGILVFANDVTQHVKSRQVIEQSAKQLQLITDALPVLIGYLDKEEKYRFANKAYEAWFPLKADDLLGRHVRDVVGEKAYAGVKQYIDRALAGERLSFESRMPYREDFVKYIQTSYIPDIQDGVVAGFYTLVNDVTEQVEARKQLEAREQEAQELSQQLALTNEELLLANEQLVRTNIDLDNFIYTASHDLKAPIYNIEGLIKILTEAIPKDTLKSTELERVLKMIDDSVRRFKNTIEHLTEVTKLQKENNQPPAAINLEEVINDVLLDLNPLLEESGADMHIDVASCPAIQFSRKNLRSVVYNLISNAIKYRSPDREPKVWISCNTDDDYHVLKVKDNGLGMSPQGRQKLFSMFGRLHDHVEGSGIGLYMVKKIVENAYGHIEVESELGAGSTFTVYFKKLD